MSTGPTPYVEMWDWSTFDRLVDLVAIAAPEFQQLAVVVGSILFTSWLVRTIALPGGGTRAE